MIKSETNEMIFQCFQVWELFSLLKCNYRCASVSWAKVIWNCNSCVTHFVLYVLRFGNDMNLLLGYLSFVYFFFVIGFRLVDCPCKCMFILIVSVWPNGKKVHACPKSLYHCPIFISVCLVFTCGVFPSLFGLNSMGIFSIQMFFWIVHSVSTHTVVKSLNNFHNITQICKESGSINWIHIADFQFSCTCLWHCQLSLNLSVICHCHCHQIE